MAAMSDALSQTGSARCERVGGRPVSLLPPTRQERRSLSLHETGEMIRLAA
ncbi:hypothetical protein [Paludibacterium yongneupense]|uniref:hypothetical protein n=1 Tax=Paludibacterium yongneupense TaxID=400061 RepID=UPI0012EB8C5A|nr:hypothetical protein [Paludibacterium yongneupense]